MLKLVAAGAASVIAAVFLRRRRGGEDVWHEATKPADLR